MQRSTSSKKSLSRIFRCKLLIFLTLPLLFYKLANKLLVSVLGVHWWQNKPSTFTLFQNGKQMMS